jgi:hypothetical protein
MIDPIQNPVITDPQPAEANQVFRQTRQLVVYYLGGVFAKPNQPTQHPATNIGVQPF